MSSEMIDKKIYYFWTGGPLTKYAQGCIESWKRFMPDYEIERIPESYVDMNLEWNKRAYKEKNWAFLSDTARINFLRTHSGIYLDTDMLMVKRIPDEMLNSPLTLGCEAETLISQGIIVKDTSQKVNELFEEWYSEYEHLNEMFLMSPKVLKPLYEKYNLIPTNNVAVNKYGMRFYGSKYFFGVICIRKSILLCDETVFIHLGMSSAIPESEYAKAQTKKFRTHNDEILEFLRNRGVEDLYNRSCERNEVNKKDDELQDISINKKLF